MTTKLPKMKPGDTQNVPLECIRPNLVALRPAELESDEFQELKTSIKQLGELLQPVRIRPQTDESSGEAYFELIDGLQRYTAVTQLGWETIPAKLTTADDERVLIEQIAANAARVQTKPAAYGRQLLRLLEINPAMTVEQLAQTVGMSTAWVNSRLALNKLVPQIGSDFVDTEAISASNAYQLARLPQDQQLDYVEQAQTDNTTDFTAAVNQKLKANRAARRQGQDPAKARAAFEPVPTLRKAADVKNADVKAVVQYAEQDTAAAGVVAALNWVLQLDKDSVAAQKERWELRRREKAEQQIANQKERAEEMAKKAAERAAELKKELGIA